jgi:hypothetical protein
MGQVLQRSASTSAAVCRAIHDRQESLRILDKSYGINQKTVAKWRRLNSTADIRPGRKNAYSTVLSIEQEAVIVAFCWHMVLPLIEAVPYRIHTVLTDNGIQFTTPGGGGSAVPLFREAIADGELFWAHAFEHACARNDVDHRTTKPKHPWTNGQVERMNRTIKEANAKRFYYETHVQLRERLANFVAAYNFAKRLKTLNGLTPYDFICKCWTKEPQRFTSNWHHQTPGPII